MDDTQRLVTIAHLETSPLVRQKSKQKDHDDVRYEQISTLLEDMLCWRMGACSAYFAVVLKVSITDIRSLIGG